ALLTAAACPRPGVRPGVPQRGEPELRVGLAVGVPSLTLGGEGGGEMFVSELGGRGLPVGSIPAGVVWRVVADSTAPGQLRVMRPDGTVDGPYRGLTVVNVTEGRFAVANGRRYRGRLTVHPGARASGAGLTLVNRVGLEGYLAGVVGPELGRRSAEEMDAVLAQAIVSRTFALRNRGRWESLGFDAHADVRDQVYHGVAAESPQVWEALRRTTGQVVRYDGRTIDAYFHSTCGFSTAGVEEAFATARARPYLRAVSDARQGGRGYYCDISPRFRWREEWDGPWLRAILTRTLPAVMPVGPGGLPRITNVVVTRTTRSGRVGELRIVFERGDVRIPAAQVRSILRPDLDRILHSGAFQLTVETRGGRLDRLVAAGAGSGHGVGMCQWGAIGRARAGQSYRTILATYFPGTKLERAY
ncbi:MAG: SpoIID/LytB domain-containing protein, partial [Gemmatimonadales bacterium]